MRPERRVPASSDRRQKATPTGGDGGRRTQQVAGRRPYPKFRSGHGAVVDVDRGAVRRPVDLDRERVQLLLQLLLGADLELASALAAEAEVLAELLERHRPIAHDALLDDVALALVEARERLADARLDHRLLLRRGELVVLR